jgi:hypothetical protein
MVPSHGIIFVLFYQNQYLSVISLSSSNKKVNAVALSGAQVYTAGHDSLDRIQHLVSRFCPQLLFTFC